MMHLGIQRKPVVFQSFNDVAFPERAGKVQGVGVQSRHQNTQLPFTARAGQGGMAHVVVQVDFLVDFPARRQYPTQQSGPGKL